MSDDRLAMQRTPYIRRALLPATMVILLIVTSITSIISSMSASEYEARSRTESTVYSANREITLLFEGARLGVDRLAEIVADASGVGTESLNEAATSLTRDNLFILGAVVQDRRGIVIAAAEPKGGLGADLSHLDYVSTLLAPGAPRHWIGEPFESRVMRDVLIPLARTVVDPRGEVIAIVAVGISRGAIRQALAGAHIGFETFLWRADGTLLVVPETARIATGRRYPNAPLWQHWRPDLDIGVYEGRNPSDGQPRLVGWRTNFVFPLIVTSGIDRSNLSDSGSNIRLTLAALAVIGVVSLAMGVLLDLRHLASQGRLIARLSATSETLRSALLARSAFLANMSHELRTPLNAVIGYTEMMRMGIYGPMTPKMDQAAQNIELAGRAQLRLVEQLLDLSRIEAGQVIVQPQALSATDLLAEAIAMITPTAQDKGVVLEAASTSEQDLIYCDHGRTIQILVNLLANAVRHSEVGEHVTGSVRRDRDGHVAIEIADRGVGLPQGSLEHLFEFSSKSDAYVSRPGRNGLGLPISRSLAQLQGGTLDIAPRSGGGAVATLILPRATGTTDPDVETR